MKELNLIKDGITGAMNCVCSFLLLSRSLINMKTTHDLSSRAYTFLTEDNGELNSFIEAVY